MANLSIQSSLKWLLERCPELEQVRLFKSYAIQGVIEDDDEVVKKLAEAFLLPKYTAPVMGCFRSMAREIVEKTVGLLRFVPNLRSNSDDAMEVDNDDDGILVNDSVVEYYSRVGKGLDLHEHACLAFCRALDLAPFLLGSVLSYFEFAPPPFQRVLPGQAISDPCVLVGRRLLSVVRTSYRLLLMAPDTFTKSWDWSCFLDLIIQYTNTYSSSCTETLEIVSDIKWCGLKIVSVALRLSDRAIENLGVECKESEALSCFSRWEGFLQDVSLEKAGWYLELSTHDESASCDGSSDFVPKNCAGSSGCQNISLSQVCLERPVKSQRCFWDCASSGNSFVLTSGVKRSFETVRLAASQNWPVLLYGASGSGKSSLISKLAQDSGKQVISIPMDDQMDGKTLIGSYVSTEHPGEFKWQLGSLSQAVLHGYWVVFEDIDKAPSDVHSIILPLLEGTSSLVTGSGEEIRVAEGFRLFSTITTSKLEISSSIKGGNSLSVFWRRVMVRPPRVEDLKDIVKASYPSLEPIAYKLIDTFVKVKSARLDQLAGFHNGNSDSVGYPSRFSLRDLLKWCKRIEGLDFSFAGNNLSVDESCAIYQEAVDIFAAFSSSIDNRLTTMEDIASLLGVQETLRETLHTANKPIIQDSLTHIRIGRVTLEPEFQTNLRAQRKSFVETRSSLHLLESLAASVKYNEPVLLVGETGTGKTTLVQDLSRRLGQKLMVLNLSQQSDVADLVGGFKPMNAESICIPLYKEFEDLFKKTFSMKANSDFLFRLQKHSIEKKWKSLLSGFQKGVDFFRKSVERGLAEPGKKRKKPLDEERIKSWENFAGNLETARCQVLASSGIIFSFVEGAFIDALKNGSWILLDEVNLAPPETLQRVSGVLEGANGSLCLAERGDVNCIHRHPNFRLFACMNPATDAGKRDLPFSLRSRFTEYFVDDILDDEELTLYVNAYSGNSKSVKDSANKIVCFYKAAKRSAEERLQDGANQKPQYSLRSLCRALEYTRHAETTPGGSKVSQGAIYDGFCMFFQTLLDRPSAKTMNQMILSYLQGGKIPPHVPFDDYLHAYGVRKKQMELHEDEFTKNYILTKSVRENLRNVARAILIKKYPVLLQGPTSSGKTSLVRYLATLTGHEFVRINNHEHTDLQEYLGTYITDHSGKLVFHEGALVRAVRNGSWIVLDELNLAPSDVLEALNRLLDDNREIFVPELQETIKANPNFMLFATQNPPTIYGGRKMLSRAFRNRFVEIHVDEIPDDELSTIIEKRCRIPGSYAKKMVDVMKELQLNRQRSKVFAGKHGYITPRDLFRWADRFRELGGRSADDLARDGYYLLAERLREEGEKSVVREVLEKHLRIKLVENDLYNKNFSVGAGDMEGSQSVTWTKSMQRLYFLVERCYRAKEPVLLVGETGGGKTTVCQLLSSRLKSNLHILNCHQYTETSDFLGGFYPIRERSTLMLEFAEKIKEFKALIKQDAFNCCNPDSDISSDIGQASSTLIALQDMIKKYKQDLIRRTTVCHEDMIKKLQDVIDSLSGLHQKWQTIFMWQDGPLVHAMKNGDLFLVDEISLADDSVIERLNSVLETERTLSLAEKGGSELEKITADKEFLLLATMNPGGDFGKKELSPALRNRFTEIWVPPVCDLDELRSIALQRFSSSKLSGVVGPMLSFWEWFGSLQTGKVLTVRDLLSWVDFVNATEGKLGVKDACRHGLFLVLLDGLSLGTGISKTHAEELRKQCSSFILEQLKLIRVDDANLAFSNYGWADLDTSGDVSSGDGMHCDKIFYPFDVEKGSVSASSALKRPLQFEFSASTTRKNALRVVRAMQLPKPVLLEGSPGVGKTSLIVALGEYFRHRVVRINLSEQTDMMDLLGSDLPVESGDGMKFAWSDGILLQALKEGSWVLLDELNLAPQSVLEGLNAILDHRAEVFIPELGCTFKCPSSFRIFACQNPTYQGGGRKGLPKSFLNRFAKVYVDELDENDYKFICKSCFPSIPKDVLDNLISFNKRLYEDTMLHHKFAQDGSPWEFNLRDVIRSCEIINGAPDKTKEYCFLNLVYVQRMRTEADRRQVVHLYEQVFKVKPCINPYPRVQLDPRYLIVGNTAIEKNYVQSSKVHSSSLKILPGIRQSLEAVAQCVKHQWLCILVGPASSGKTSLVRLLAELTGNVVNELHLSSGTDISEILGCFEQYNAIRNFRSVVAQMQGYIDEYCYSKKDLMTEGFITKWFAFSSSISDDFLSCFTNRNEEARKRFIDSLTLLKEIIGQLELILEKNKPGLSWSDEQLGRAKRTIDRAMRTIDKLLEGHKKGSFSAKFEWVAGLLVKAIERGEWIVLENANCCNPTVLDRINSLVEPSGSITINECGIVDGKPVILHPHPNFRMFLTVNPSFGEVSRAMRNRGVEIFLMQPCWLPDESTGFNSDEFELKDVNRFLVLSGIPIDSLVQAMSKAHVYARKEGLRFDVSITYLELSHWVQLFQQFIMNGNELIWSLQTSWEHIYLSSFGEADGGSTVSRAKDAYLSVTGLSGSCMLPSPSLSLPGGWPKPLKLSDFVLSLRECTVKQNCMYLDYLAAQCASNEMRGKGRNICQNSTACDIEPCLMDAKMLCQYMFPGDPKSLTSNLRDNFDFKVAKKKLWFAANWTIEQASETDLRLHLLWFNKFSPKFQLLSQFSELIEKIMEHRIWKDLTDCYNELLKKLSNYKNLPIPVLSVELVDEIFTDDEKKCLCIVINRVYPLKLTYKQWSDELKHNDNIKNDHLKDMVESLRKLEEDFLKKLADAPVNVNIEESQLLDSNIETYVNFLENHKLFWKGVKKIKNPKDDLGQLRIPWRLLLKNAAKLKDICPEAVHRLLDMGNNLEKVLSWPLHSEKSLLWAYGGHPVLPSSADLFHRQLELLKFCELLWPTKMKSTICNKEKAESENPVGKCMIEIVASFNPSLRNLAVEGISKFPSITNQLDAAQQLNEIYEEFKKCFELAKHNCKKIFGHNKLEVPKEHSSAVCSYSAEILCHKSGFDSWQDTLPLIDITSFYLDMELLQELSCALLVDSRTLNLEFSSISKRLEAALNFSLVCSSRPPQMFSPHKKLLWILDAWTLVDAVNAKVASFVLEMWFRWHQSLWIYHPVSVQDSSETPQQDSVAKSEGDCHNIPGPDVLVHPVIMNTVNQIVQNPTPVKDYLESSLKLKVASCNLWRCLSPGSKLPGFLSSALWCLFEQIINAHEKAFESDKFKNIKSIVRELSTNMIEKENFNRKLQEIESAILSSSHQGLKTVMRKHIGPLIRELRHDCSSTDYISHIGCAWLHLGALRLNLLLSCDDLDPAMKHHYKNSQLADKISSLKLEIQVRQECNYLVGRLSTREDDKKEALESLEVKRTRLQRKIVFRSDYRKFKNLKRQCGEFQEHVRRQLEFLSTDINAMDLKKICDEWQITAIRFIERLSVDYPEYIDFVQPVQVAIYELKLGFSLLSRVEKNKMDVESIYTFMRFPSTSPAKTKSIKIEREQPGFPPYELEIYSDFCAEDVDVSHKLDMLFSKQPEVSRSQLNAYLHQNILFRSAHSVSNAHIIDPALFQTLHESFMIFADFWKTMKENQVKMREDDSQQYKFRTRAFKIENVIELDISTLGKSLANESFLEWKELVLEDEQREDTCKQQDNSEEEWNLIDESVLNSVVCIHDQLFGLTSSITTGAFQISDEDRFVSFIGSYNFGTTIVRGLAGSFLSNLDARLAPEHLLRLSLEYDQKFVSSHKSARRYNFYKDSNALEMSKMAKLLYPLQQRVLSLVHECEYDHALQKILNVVEMLLDIPLSTPLAKVLSGLQFLVNNIRMLQENGTKFPISDQLDSILVLVVSWQKLEFESWPVLLDEVQHQYDINAEKLWFPLYPILLRKNWSGISNNIQSFEDFMQSSSIGEFRRRLQLLFAFLGQIYTGHCLKFDPRWSEKENMDMFCYEEEKMKILFNVIGFYVQFLPRILEHIEASRKNIEKELKELLKLCSWERPESSLSIENSKRTRQKFKKLMQKYNDLLQQPAMLFLNQDAELKKTIQSEGQKFLSYDMERNSRMIDASSEQSLHDGKDKFKWYAEWRKKADGAIRGLKLSKTPKLSVLHSLSEGIIRQCSSSQSAHLSYKDEWKAVWFKLERISKTVVDCGDLWKEENKSQQKRRALSELLKLLESSGLSRHKPVDIEDQLKSWWFLEPSHELQHLLKAESALTHLVYDATLNLRKSERSPHKYMITEWRAATECYFRSIISVLLLRQICLNFHKDITIEQVERSGSFLYQLIEILKQQHAAAVVFAEHLKCFKERISILKNLHSNYTSSDVGSHHSNFDAVRNEDAIFKCMWRQKQLFDSLYAISHDELLLLRTFEHTHSEACENVKASSRAILATMEKFSLIFKNSKELLDDNLLSRDRDITKVPASPHLFVVSKEMEALLSYNFQIIDDFEKHLDGLNNGDADRSLVKETLLGHFKEAFEKKKSLEDEFISETLVKNVSLRVSDKGICDKGFSKLDDKLFPALQRTFEHIKQAMQILSSPPNEKGLPDELVGSITSWHVIFDSLAKKLSLEHLCSELLEVISRAKELLKDSGDEFQCVSVQIGAHFKNLLVFLDMLSNFGDGLLQEHLDMHKTVSMMTRVLADVLASLYSSGFGVYTEDQVSNGTQDASGTGMGEGVGAKDVSDQITDEDQLLGASDKREEEQDASGEAPNKHDKGIEMDQDFDADTYDVSEDSEEGMDEDGEDDQLDSAMGETGADSEVVNEKLWNKDEDESPNEATEKYESGPSVKDTDASSRELRAKDDSALTDNEPGEFNSQEGDKSDAETGEQDDACDDLKDIEGVNLDKEEAFADPTGLNPDDGKQSFEEDMDLDKEEGTESVEEDAAEVQDEAADYQNSEDENPCPDDETMKEAETGQLDATSERDELGGDHEQSAETNLMGSRSEMFGQGTADSFGGDSVPNSESSTQPKSDLQASDLSNMAPEMNWSNNNDTHGGLAPLRGLPSNNTSELDRMVSESMTGGRNSSDQPQTQLPRHETSSVQKNEANPYRSHGDPLKDWREGVNVGVDLEADDTDTQGDIHDENADEFGYVSKFEKGTSQALGPATTEQVDTNVNSKKTNENEPTTDRDDITEMEIDKGTPETHPLKNGTFLKSKFGDKKPIPDLEKIPREESKEIQGQGDDDFNGLSDGIVSVRKSYFGEGVNQLSKLSINDNELGKAQDLGDISAEALNNSTALWRRYELSTTRLSQELAEQLRLVMEPTVASKLQGDYKTGKRINMKKVIPYIASHFRRDKIWLRRTRPNKRDYQVVIAVDDSRSMSESCCGNVAIEALVAVCRAMSQLEMGNLAVTSFGKKGNIRLLHDFDQPFTAETGVKMISSFTFEQENTIADEPVVDLLKYLNNKLDAAVARARLPSGQNPLEQLVLIIADGRFHEKENLKRCVRDFLSRKRMVAFLLLDSPQESIVDLMEASFEGGNIKFSKYLDSFPFPFYIVLRNIEALPRTLADLLRQWFELMQYSRE